MVMRRIHLFLNVFFSPLLLMFILTGWWQTVATDEEQEQTGGVFHDLIKKFSEVHTDSHFPKAGGHPHEWVMKTLVVAMCVALVLSIALGLGLAWQTMKNKWSVGLAFTLGILIPALVLYLT